MADKFSDIQRTFAAHIREPSLHPAPTDVEDRRMKIYRELFYKNIEGFISSAFPVLRKLYSDTHWHQMVRDFIHRHQSQTPYFLEVSEEFLAYLEGEREPADCDPVFALALARYEWAELALFVAEQSIPEDSLPIDQSLLDHVPVLSPLAWSMVFDYPVHKIGETFQPEQPSEQPVCLVVYRNRQDKVAFLEANPVT
ncbi:MAG: putative DNA-binding domain-containing protein, partial [Pseudomonadales bacterium]|nr:putative DNA-binding domain-containing protein [Pseudomonadales bacterium]